MKNLIIILCSFLGGVMVFQNPAHAQSPRWVKLSNFDPSSYRDFNHDPYNPPIGRKWAYSDLWGYVDEFGNEYVLFPSSSGNNGGSPLQGLSIIDINDPFNPVEVKFIPLYNSILRDVKTYGDYAYVVSDGCEPTGGWCFGTGNQSGIAIIDLSPLPSNPAAVSVVNVYQDIRKAHNIFIDEYTGKLYAGFSSGGLSNAIKANDVLSGNSPCPSINQNNGNTIWNIGIADLNPNPAFPTPIGCMTLAGTHDIHARRDTFYVAGGCHTEVKVYTWNSPTTMTHIASHDFNQYVNAPEEYHPHDLWITDNGKYMVASDEHKHKPNMLMDITNIGSGVMTRIDTIERSQNRHNNVIKGNNRLYTAHYQDGLRVYDISGLNPANPYSNSAPEIGHYDTFIDRLITPNPGFNGAFGVWPFFPSGVIAVSDMNYGLHLIYPCVPQTWTDGVVVPLDEFDIPNNNIVDNMEVYGWSAVDDIVMNAGGNGFRVQRDGNVTLIAGKKIHIQQGLYVTGEGKFHAQIGRICPPPCDPTDPGCIEERSGAIENSNMPPEVHPKRKTPIRLAPNPTNNISHLQFHLDDRSVVSVWVTDMLGRRVLEISNKQQLPSGYHDFEIDLSGFESGIYLVNFVNDKQFSTVKLKKSN